MKWFHLFAFMVVFMIPVSAYSQEGYIQEIREDGLLMEQHLFAPDSTLVKSIHYIYDTQGNLMMDITYAYGHIGVVETRSVGIYKKGRLTSRQLYSSDDLLLFKDKFYYNRHGDLSRRKQTNYEEEKSTTTIERRHYTYKNDTISSARYFINGTLYYSK